MAVSKQQFTHHSLGITAYFRQRGTSPFGRTTKTLNSIIALFIIPVLILPMQADAETILQPAEAPHTAVNKAESVPLSANTTAEIGNRNTTDTAALELAAIPLAPGTEQSAAIVNKDIKPNTATTLMSVTGSGYVKIAYSGDALDEKAESWECVEDKSSKLTWEVKRNDGGIRDKDYSYTWLRNINGEVNGVSDGGRCRGGVKCDTYSYARAMNEQKLCGYSDWRLPTREEMETLVDYNTAAQGATINSTFFPEAVPSWYWTATENPGRDKFAWYVLFRNGIALNDLKERPKHVRLVRGNQAQ